MKNLIASIGIILFIVGGCAMDGPLLIPVVAVLVGLGLFCMSSLGNPTMNGSNA